MSRNGLLIEYEYCTGCHACEVACKQEHNYGGGVCGIRVDELVTAGPDKVQVDNVPILTRFCDLCAARTLAHEEPTCVKHCQASCLLYGPITELVKEMEKRPRSSIYAPK